MRFKCLKGKIFITVGERSVACGRKDKVKTLCELCVIFANFVVKKVKNLYNQFCKAVFLTRSNFDNADRLPILLKHILG